VTAEAVPQHLEALELANGTRMWRAGFKWSAARLPESSGRALVAAIILERPRSAASMSLMEVLGVIHRFGRRRALKLCQTVDVVENKRIGTLTDRQAALLAELLTDGLASSSARSAETGQRA
jgi:hypothetical protein